MTETMGWRMRIAMAVAAGAAICLLSTPVRAQETGESLFKAKCAMCHSADGSGKSPMGEKLKIRDLHSADVQKQTDAELSAIITKGKEKMPAYESKLTKEQIEKLVAFVRALGKK